MTEREWTEKECKEFWKECCAAGEIPDDIPENPDEVYADEWTSWKDWFGIREDKGEEL